MTARPFFKPHPQRCWCVLLRVVLGLFSFNAPCKDWPQWGGSNARNMVSEEKRLPDWFVPGEKDSQAGRIMVETTKNAKWATKLCQAIYSTPVVADGKVYMPTPKGLFVLAAGKEKKVLSQINVGAPIYATPVAANGTLYIAARSGWLWAVTLNRP